MNTNEQAPECCPFCGAGKKRHLPHIAFRWFECGTMTAPVKTPRRDQTPACATAERERLTRERDELRAWKDSAMAVEREWDANAIATMLGGRLGESQRAAIAREVPKLLTRVKRLEEAGDELTNCIACGCNDGGCKTCRVSEDKWRKAKEAKP